MTTLSPIEQTILGQLEAKAQEHQRYALRAAENGSLSDAAYWQRWTVAFCNAADDFERGRRAEQTSSGAWLVSSSSSAKIHRIKRGECNCTAGERGNPCRHAALAVGYELAYDELALSYDPPNEPSPLGDEPGDTPPTGWGRALGARLCAARSHLAWA